MDLGLQFICRYVVLTEKPQNLFPRHLFNIISWLFCSAFDACVYSFAWTALFLWGFKFVSVTSTDQHTSLSGS